MKTKNNYTSPRVEIVTLMPEGVCDVIKPSGPSDDFAKENNITFDDWDDDEAIFKDLWAEDEEEKKELW